MPGRTPREARDAFLEPLRQSASCVTHIPLQPSYGSDRLGFLHAVTFAGAKPVKLNTTSDRGPIYLRMRMNFAIVPPRGRVQGQHPRLRLPHRQR